MPVFPIHLGSSELCAEMQEEIDESDDEAAKSTKRPGKVSNFHARIRAWSTLSLYL